MSTSWLARHGTTLIALGAGLVLALVALLLWKPPWSTHQPAPAGEKSSPGWGIRYNATITLARRGSKKTRLDILDEMLDEDKQRANFRTRITNGEEVVNEQREQDVFGALNTALDATVKYQEKTNDPKLVALKPALEKLAAGSNRALQEKAKTLLEKIS